MNTLAHVRIFAAGEFAAPAGWPEDVGVAVISAEGIEVFPAHARESGAEVLRRIAALSDSDLRLSPVHPPVEGHPPCDLPFSAVADLRSAVEDFLSRFPEAVDEADDFSVNFGYAVDEGIAFPALLTQTPAPPVAVSDGPVAPIAPAAPTLAGYVALSDGQSPPIRFSRPVLRVSADGGLLVLLDPDMPVLASSSPPVLLREDGMGLAVPVDALHSPEGALCALRLAAGCLPWLPEGVEGEIPLVATERGGFLLLSFLPEWAWSAPRAEADDRPAWQAEPTAPRATLLPEALVGFWRRRLIGVAAVVAIVIGAGFGVAGRGDAKDDPVPPVAAVDALRAGLFD